MTQDLPTGWVETTLGEAGKWTSGGTPSRKKDEYFGGDIPWVLTGDLPDGVVKTVPQTLTEAGIQNSSAKVFPPGTLLVAMYGATIGKLGVLQFGAATNQACAALLPSEHNKGVLPFIFYFLLSERQNLKKIGQGGAQPNISQNILKHYSIPFAPLPEQQRIVSKIEELFSRLDAGEAALRRVQKLLATYRQSVLKAAVTGELTREWREENGPRLEPGAVLLQRILKARREQWQGRGKYQEPKAPNTEGLPALPAGWVWATSDQIISYLGNGLPRKPASYQTDYPILRISAVRPMSVNMSDIRFYEPREGENLDNYWAKQGDLLFTRYNGSGHLVGVCGLHRGQTILHPDKIIKMRTIEIQGLNKEYLEICFNVGESRNFIKRHIKTTAGQQGIAGGELKLTPIPLASAEEQVKIVRGHLVLNHHNDTDLDVFVNRPRSIPIDAR
jgi:type I restriction enzyme, S subunit